jgi:PAS domain S-box-containing protein
MTINNRDTGIDTIGSVPWGTHFCQFCQTRQDLVDILVPYFRAGLENNELCLWITSAPLVVEAARESLSKAVSGLDDYITKGQIEILDASQWYTKSGSFRSDEVLQSWIEKEHQALEKGFDGLRLTGNTFWLEQKDWRDSTDYEATMDRIIGQYRMIAFCTYPLDRCGASELIDVVSNHQFALIKREGKWQAIESTERRQTEEALRRQTHDLGERVKELDCLYGISQLAAKRGVSFDEILQGTVDLIPPAWQYPEVTCARIRLEGQEFVTKDCKETVWRQACDILVGGEPIGAVEVYYLEEMPTSDEGPFLNEERNLIDAIARRVGDITERKRAEQALQNALEDAQQHQVEISSLLEGSRAVLQHHQFKGAARSIFDSCKNIIGASAGYVALLSRDGTENEVVFLESGGLPCMVDPSLSMPIRGLRAEAYRLGKAVHDNEFSSSEWVTYLPQGHVGLDNVLFAPLVIEGKVVGLLGLANKPGGFTENDARLATAFGELAAVALFNSRIFESLEDSEERFRSVVETASDAIVAVDGQGNIVFWNHGAEMMFGYSADEVVGRPTTIVMPERLHEAHRQGLQRVVSTGKSKIIGKTIEVVGLEKDGDEFPLELSLASWKTREGIFFTAIIRDITEHKKLDQLKDDFIGLVSHEIRTPLTVIIGSLNTVLSEEKRLTSAEIGQLLRDATLEAESLSHLLGNLVELSRAQAEQLSLYTEPVNIHRVVQETTERIKRQDSIAKFVINLPRELPLVDADPLRLERILYNLLENAVKYSPQGSEIQILAKPGKDFLIIGVTDQGVGISPQDKAKLFQPFQRLEQPEFERVKGIGLGLLVCQRLVEAHGGQIWLESEPGRGSTFFFTVPLSH